APCSRWRSLRSTAQPAQNPGTPFLLTDRGGRFASAARPIAAFGSGYIRAKKKRCHPGSAFTNPLFAYPSSTSHNASSSASLNKPAG
uniref:hypothetical protein n=1 Tax=Pseudomonas chlororaphis TaxID=587753 RepID=UPI001C829BC0